MDNLIKKYEERRAALLEQSEKSNSVEELRGIQNQLLQVNNDINDLRAVMTKNISDERTTAVNSNVEKRSDTPNFVQGKGFSPVEERGNFDYSKILETREKAGNDLKEKRAVDSPLGLFGELRAVTVGNGTSIIVPQTFSGTINPEFNLVSSLIDSVSHLSLNGGESFKQGYVNSVAAGDYTSETAVAATAETEFAYAEISKAKITAYSEVTEELQKLPNANYADVVFQNIRKSMRMKLTNQILLGGGGTNQITGIFSSAATAIDSTTDLALTTINDKTLDEIIFHYGGNEDVEGSAVLILNKLDLLEFAKVRTSTTLRYYNIEYNGNSGRINGVPFIINSACNQLTGTSTTAGAYCMAYGHLTNYQLVEFSPMEVKISDDYKFKEGMTAYRGVVFAGGNVVKKNGFIRIKKGS